MNIPTIPFVEEGDQVKLTGPVFLSCGCGGTTARWATVAQNLSTRIPQAKPKSSKIVSKWIEQNNLKKKIPLLAKHQYGVVVAEVRCEIEWVDISKVDTMKVAQEIGDLIRRSKEKQ